MPLTKLPDWIWHGRGGPIPKVGDVFVVESVSEYYKGDHNETVRFVTLRRFRPEAYDDRQLRLITED